MNCQWRTYLVVILLIGTCGCARDVQEGPTIRAQGPASDQPGEARDNPLSIVDRIATHSGATVLKLSNGMTVVVKPTRYAPVVCVRSYVRAGGLYENQWLGSGISHLTEHIVAKGAVHDMGPGVTDKSVTQTAGRVKEIGGQSNAYTSLDHTCYYISAASGKTMDCIDLMADWMVRPEITAEDFQREHGVVQRELETGKDDPLRAISRAHAGNFFSGHPAGVPVIGVEGPLAELTLQDVVTYHQQMYVPQNMILSVVGDIDVQGVIERIRRAFAGSRKGRTPNLILPPVPKVAGVRRTVRTHKALKEAMQRMSFRTIPLVHEDLYALDVLSYVLTRGQASRLVRRIEREKKLVTAISSSSWTPGWGTGMFTISFRSGPEKAVPPEQAILIELQRIIDDGLEADELRRAKRQKSADFVYSQQTVESIAARLATDYLSTGDVDFSQTYTQRIQEVTAQQVQQVARKYFKFDAMVVTRLEPVTGEGVAPRDSQTHERGAQERTSMFKLPNALRVILHPSDAVGLVAMAFTARGGVLLEDENTNGMGALMTGLSTKGAGPRSAEQIAEFFAEAGGSVAGNCGNNSFYWRGTVLDDRFDEAMEIFSDIIIRPTFTQEELEILRPILTTRIKQQDERWREQLFKFFRSSFFTHSPYRLLPVGRTEVIAQATAEQIRQYHRKYILGGSSVLAIYGNFDRGTATELIRKLFVNLPPGKTEVPVPPTPRVAPMGERHVLNTENRIAGVFVAAPGMKISDVQDRFAINVLDTIISGWYLPEGWLHSELRGKELVYVVHAYNWIGLAPGAFCVYAGCQPQKVDQVLEIIKRNLGKAANYEPTQQEIDLAVNSILTAELLQNQEMSSLAMSAALDELYGLGYDFRTKIEENYRSVTPQEVLRVGEKYLGRGYVVAITSPGLPPSEID